MRWSALLVLIVLIPACYSTESFQVDSVRTFVSPDSSLVELERIIGAAKSSVYVNTYTFTNPNAAALLENAKSKGTDVFLMLEVSPVGGIPKDESILVERLSNAGIKVCFYSDNKTKFNHAKYVVVDNLSTLISTENLGSDGFPEENSYGERGWGVVIASREFSVAMAGLFFSDLTHCGARRLSKDGKQNKVEGRSYDPVFAGKEFAGTHRVELFNAPEEGIDPIVRLLESAKDSIVVEQAYIYDHWGSKKGKNYAEEPNPFLEAAIRAARRGVKVRILMDSYWYNVLEYDPVNNRKTLEYVNSVAGKEGLDLEARLIDLDELDLLRLHTKGVVVDGNAVLVSSINWNEHSPTKNREVGVIIYGEPAAYFASVFECDWEPSSCKGGQTSPWIYALAVAFPSAYLVKKRRFGWHTNSNKCGEANGDRYSKQENQDSLE